jgi:hypothetical protein
MVQVVAEDFMQWVIEDKFVDNCRPQWEQVRLMASLIIILNHAFAGRLNCFTQPRALLELPMTAAKVPHSCCCALLRLGF